MTQHPRVGLGVFILKEGRVLLGLRKNSHGEGTWCPPGGHLEFGESWDACARRETREECALELANVRLGTISNDIFEQEGKHYVSIIMLADYAGGEPRICEPEKLSQWEWFDWDHFPQPLFLPIVNIREKGFHPFA